MLGLDKVDRKNIMRFFPYALKHKGKLSAVIIFFIFEMVVDIFSPILWGKTIYYLTLLDREKFLSAVVLYVLSIILKFGIGFIKAIISVRLENGMSYDISKDMFNKMANFPMKVFDDYSHGEIISRLNGDSDIVISLFSNKIIIILFNLVEFIVMVIVCVKISWKLSLIVFISLPVTSIIYKFTGKLLREKNKELKKLFDQLYSCINQTIKAIYDIRAFGNTRKIIEDYNELNKSIFSKRKKADLIALYGRSSSGFSTAMMNVLIVIVGSILIFNDSFTIDLYIAFFGYAASLTAIILQLTSFNTILQQGMVSINRLVEFNNNLGYENSSYGAKEISSITKGVEFKDVSFEYEENQPVLENVSLNIPMGKKIGIIGRSGSGKSTIINLIMRFYKLKNGSIEVDGININDIDEESLHKQIAVVRQEPYLFNQSIRINLMLAKPDATNDEIEEACKKAQIHDFIMGLPQKYDTFIGENGTKLSGGQRQRIAIAKALLKRASIIFFDESTSALDNATQESISEVIDDIGKDNSVIIITHKLQTVKNCDKIILIENNKIEASGRHDELMKNSTLYKSLFDKEEISFENENNYFIKEQ